MSMFWNHTSSISTCHSHCSTSPLHVFAPAGVDVMGLGLPPPRPWEAVSSILISRGKGSSLPLVLIVYKFLPKVRGHCAKCVLHFPNP